MRIPPGVGLNGDSIRRQKHQLERRLTICQGATNEPVVSFWLTQTRRPLRRIWIVVPLALIFQQSSEHLVHLSLYIGGR